MRREYLILKWVVHTRTPFEAEASSWVLVEAKDKEAAEAKVGFGGIYRVTAVEPYDPKVHKLTRW